MSWLELETFPSVCVWGRTCVRMEMLFDIKVSLPWHVGNHSYTQTYFRLHSAGQAFLPLCQHSPGSEQGSKGTHWAVGFLLGHFKVVFRAFPPPWMPRGSSLAQNCFQVSLRVLRVLFHGLSWLVLWLCGCWHVLRGSGNWASHSGEPDKSPSLQPEFSGSSLCT